MTSLDCQQRSPIYVAPQPPPPQRSQAITTVTKPGKALVIVESPTKARTISNFLPKGFVVEASIGHVRDLPNSAKEIPAAIKKEPWSRLGINVDDEFQPVYIVPSEKKKQVTKLKKLLKGVDVLYLATD